MLGLFSGLLCGLLFFYFFLWLRFTWNFAEIWQPWIMTTLVDSLLTLLCVTGNTPGVWNTVERLQGASKTTQTELTDYMMDDCMLFSQLPVTGLKKNKNHFITAYSNSVQGFVIINAVLLHQNLRSRAAAAHYLNMYNNILAIYWARGTLYFRTIHCLNTLASTRHYL